MRKKLHARLKFVRQRQGKWATLRRGGGSTKRLAVTGASPALLYGTRVVGANDAEFHAIRREVATAAGNTGGGKSMLMGFLLDGSAVVNSDPAFRLTTGPVIEWSTALWSGEVPLEVLDRVARIAASRLAGRRRPWLGAHGPGGVLLLTLRRMGWRLFDARTLEDDRGSRVDLLRVGPREVRCMVERGVSRWQHRMAAAEFGAPPLASGLRLEPLRKVLRKLPVGAPRGNLRSTITGGQWPQARLARAKLHSSSFCQRCVWEDIGLPGTLLHRHLVCDAVETNRRQWLLPSIVAAGEVAQRSG